MGMAWLTVEQAGDVSREIITDACCHSRHSQWGNVVHCLFVKIPVSAPPPLPQPSVSVRFELQKQDT